jgi:hypothetical protein
MAFYIIEEWLIAFNARLKRQNYNEGGEGGRKRMRRTATVGTLVSYHDLQKTYRPPDVFTKSK